MTTAQEVIDSYRKKIKAFEQTWSLGANMNMKLHVNGSIRILNPNGRGIKGRAQLIAIVRKNIAEDKIIGYKWIWAWACKLDAPKIDQSIIQGYYTTKFPAFARQVNVPDLELKAAVQELFIRGSCLFAYNFEYVCEFESVDGALVILGVSSVKGTVISSAENEKLIASTAASADATAKYLEAERHARQPKPIITEDEFKRRVQESVDARDEEDSDDETTLSTTASNVEFGDIGSRFEEDLGIKLKKIES